MQGCVVARGGEVKQVASPPAHEIGRAARHLRVLFTTFAAKCLPMRQSCLICAAMNAGDIAGRIADAMSRIDAAAARIEAAAAAPSPAASSDDALQERYDALRREAGTALRELDAMIAAIEV